jgi:replicative superfamily II helicase
MATKSATARMLQLAGFQRLLSQINTDEVVQDQTHIMRLAEERTYAYTKTLEPKELRTDPASIYAQLQEIYKPFQFKYKPSFLALWDFVLNGFGEPLQIKTHLENIKSVSHNNRLKRLILPQLQTVVKYNGIVKHILNLGKEFNSLFDEVDLTSVETILRTNAKREEAEMQFSLDTFLSKPVFDSDEEVVCQQFYGCISKLSNPNLRNLYFNRLLQHLMLQMTASPSNQLTNLFILFYDRLSNHELVNMIDPAITKWLDANPIPFFSHSMSKLSLLLPPYSPFQKAMITLDPWQREGIAAMRKGHSVFLDIPTSGGKTLAASEAVNIYENVLYVMPERPLAEQFTSIVVATLTDSERQKGVLERNVRQELNGEHRPYRRFDRKDNIVVGMPQRIYELLHSKRLTIPFQCVVLDEFHNISDPEHGPYYQYILYWAAYHNLPVIAMTATLRNGPEIAAKIQSIVAQPLFAVHQKKRFFNQRRMVFRTDEATQKISLVTVNPLDHLRRETLESPYFRHPGLVPGELLRLYNNVPSFKRIDERISRIPTLDDVESIEESLFQHIAVQPPEILATLIKAEPLSGDQLTPYQIVTTLRTLNNEHKPLLMFKSDPLDCLRFHKSLFVDLLVEENDIVYGNFQDDQAIIKQYLQDIEPLLAEDNGAGTAITEERKDTSRPGKVAVDHQETRRKQQETIFNTRCLPALLKFDKEYVQPKPDPIRLATFNAKYGANLTQDYIIKRRKEHIEEQDRTYTTVGLRSEYTIHRKIKISSYSNGSIMKEIKDLIETELGFQQKQTGAFPLMQAFGPEFAAYDDIIETRAWSHNDKETHKLGTPWPSKRLDTEDVTYSYKISYDHPILVAIECGILFNNALLNPAFIYICQLLISKHPLVVLSCKSYATGVNFPFKTVWVQGSFKGQPLESLPNALVWQMMGRGGRRGLFRLAMGIYSGIETSHVMFPEFKPVVFNSFDAMAPLLTGAEEDFVTFVRTDRRPEAKPEIKVKSSQKLIATTITSTNSSSNTAITTTTESKSPHPFDEKMMEGLTWEEMCDLLEG